MPEIKPVTLLELKPTSLARTQTSQPARARTHINHSDQNLIQLSIPEHKPVGEEIKQVSQEKSQPSQPGKSLNQPIVSELRPQPGQN